MSYINLSASVDLNFRIIKLVNFQESQDISLMFLAFMWSNKHFNFRETRPDVRLATHAPPSQLVRKVFSCHRSINSQRFITQKNHFPFSFLLPIQLLNNVDQLYCKELLLFAKPFILRNLLYILLFPECLFLETPGQKF